MNRRRFLSFLGLAPVAAALPAMALPRPDKPTDIAEGMFRVIGDENGEQHGLVVDGRPVKCKFPVSAIKGDAEIVLFKDGQLIIRPARVNS